MKTKKMGVFGLLLGVLLTYHVSVFAHPAYNKLVVFGDSLSDPGNAFALTGQFSVRPFSLIPDAPYARGGMHFSNGKTWAELLAKDLHLPSGPAFRNPLLFSNYAIGSARAHNTGTGADLTDQVSLYLGEHRGNADPHALYVVLIGGNDLRDAIAVYQSNPSGASRILNAAVTSVANNLQSLALAGAHYFLIGYVPDLSLVPAVAMQGVPVQTLAQTLSIQYNRGLKGVVTAMMNAPYSPDVTTLNLYRLLHSLDAYPEQIGLTNVSSTCINPGVIAHAVCHDTKDYLFWDGIHPTHVVHEFLANEALQALH